MLVAMQILILRANIDTTCNLFEVLVLVRLSNLQHMLRLSLVHDEIL